MPQERLVEGRTGTLPDGTRVVVRNGQVVRADAPTSGPEAAGFTPLGDGWWRASDGSTYQEGRGGALVQRTEAAADAENPDIREFQANAAARATLMDQGLINYNAARAEGYDPTSFRNAAARNIEGVWGIGVPLSNLIRDPVADRGRSAELSFADGALRTTTGANAPEPEVVRADRQFFLAPGESESSEAGKAMLRDRFRNQSVRIAGDAYTPMPEANASGSIRIRDLLPDETPEALAASGRVRGSDGVWRYPRDEQGNPIFPEDTGGSPPAGGGTSGVDGSARPGSGGEAAPAMGGYETALAQERANADLVSRAGGGVDMGLQFTGPFNDELAYAEGFLRQGAGNIGRRLTGRDIEVSAAERGRASQNVMRQDQDRFARERPVQNIAANVLGAAAVKVDVLDEKLPLDTFVAYKTSVKFITFV